MKQRGLAPILIILLLAAAVGGYFLYQKQVKSIPVQKTTQLLSAKEKIEFNNGSLQICGDVPDEAFPSYGHFEIRKGPEWSSDCKHIAWSMWQSGTGCDSCPAGVLSDKAGVFIYRVTDKKVVKVYNPQDLSDAAEFLGWVDNNNFLFKVDKKKYEYSLVTNKFLDQK